MSDVLDQAGGREDDCVGVEEFTTYDPADDLISDESIAYFMEEALKTNDPEFIAHALGTAARAKGMMKISEETGLTREQLSLSYRVKDEPTLRGALSAMQALGIQLATTRVTEKTHGMA